MLDSARHHSAVQSRYIKLWLWRLSVSTKDPRVEVGNTTER